MAETPPRSGSDEPKPFDREAARARYRKLMRSWPMRMTYLLLALTILFAWAWGIAAAVAPDVETIPGHDITVPTGECLSCHAGAEGGQPKPGVPAMGHPAAPSCGFCHRQGPPETGAAGWVRPAQ